jgi:AbiV family abortive infection protein
MESLEFNNLTQEQAEEGFRLCADNADIHYEMAALIAKEGHYPMANSHLILSMEEAVKAIFLFLKYINNEVNIDVKKMFKKHQHKHEFARDSYDVFHIKGIEFIEQIINAHKISFSKEMLSQLDEVEVENIQVTIQVLEARYKRIKSLNLEESLPNIHKWFNKADLRKSRGFYVDFQNNQWKKPNEITQEDYKFSEFVCWTLILIARQFKMTEELKKKSEELKRNQRNEVFVERRIGRLFILKN